MAVLEIKKKRERERERKQTQHVIRKKKRIEFSFKEEFCSFVLIL